MEGNVPKDAGWHQPHQREVQQRQLQRRCRCGRARGSRAVDERRQGEGQGDQRKADLSGLTSGKNQTITIYRVKNGKSAKIIIAKSNSKGNWSKKNVAIKTGGTVYVYTYTLKKKKSNKAKV